MIFLQILSAECSGSLQKRNEKVDGLDTKSKPADEGRWGLSDIGVLKSGSLPPKFTRRCKLVSCDNSGFGTEDLAAESDNKTLSESGESCELYYIRSDDR